MLQSMAMLLNVTFDYPPCATMIVLNQDPVRLLFKKNREFETISVTNLAKLKN